VPNAPDDGLLHTLADIPGLVQPSGTASAITGTPGPGVQAWTTTEPRRPERAHRSSWATDGWAVTPEIDTHEGRWAIHGHTPLAGAQTVMAPGRGPPDS
jgi:hypothetical protein